MNNRRWLAVCLALMLALCALPSAVAEEEYILTDACRIDGEYAFDLKLVENVAFEQDDEGNYPDSPTHKYVKIVVNVTNLSQTAVDFAETLDGSLSFMDEWSFDKILISSESDVLNSLLRQDIIWVFEAPNLVFEAEYVEGLSAKLNIKGVSVIIPLSGIGEAKPEYTVGAAPQIDQTPDVTTPDVITPPIPTTTTEPEPDGLDIAFDGILTFGTYQDEPITWRAIDNRDGATLWIATNILDAVALDNDDSAWSDSELRAWMNGDFLDNFTDAQRARILPVVNTALNSQYSKTVIGADSEDYVFILSADEAAAYFDGNDDRVTDPTAYCTSMQSAVSGWWLRTPGIIRSMNAYVSMNGEVVGYGAFSNDTTYGVRPAMWIED